MKTEHPWLDRLFDGKVIVNCEREPYLLRWYIFKTRWVSLFLHKFVRSDEDRALHDHPWAFLVIPIWRGYMEHNEIVADAPVPGGVHRWDNKTRVLPFIGTRYRNELYRHRVELLTDAAGKPLPAWSLFFHFEKRREWGFWPKEGFIQWNKWWQDKCE
jgi:hypothetical protein